MLVAGIMINSDSPDGGDNVVANLTVFLCLQQLPDMV